MARILIGNIKGPKGDTGARGATGPQGATGPTGPMPPLTNNALATTPGVSALDAVMGKTLDDKIGKVNSDLSNQRRTITRVRVAITNGVGTYNVTQVGLSGGNCIPVIYSMSDGIFWSEVSVAIQNDLVVVGFSSGQSGWAEVNIFSFE